MNFGIRLIFHFLGITNGLMCLCNIIVLLHNTCTCTQIDVGICIWKDSHSNAVVGME